MDLKFYSVATIHFLCSALVFYGIVRTFIVYLLFACSFCNPLNFVATVFLAKFTFKYVKNQFLNEKVDTQRAVFITGCDTGFGHLLAKRLDAEGYYVFASCLFQSGPGATSLKETCSKRLKVLELDVSKDDSVSSAAEYVKQNLESRELWAVVNNAGIQEGFSLELSAIDEFQKSMEVNAIGPVRVAKAFLPLLKQSKGRIVNVTSLSGKVCMPYVLPYFMSKYAARGFNDCLRQELDEWGIKVISIEPETFQTPIANAKIIKEKLQRVIDNMGSRVKTDLEKHLATLKKISVIVPGLASPKVELVVDDLESAVTSKYPDSVYKPRRSFPSRIIIWLYEVIPVDFQFLTCKIVLNVVRYFF